MRRRALAAALAALTALACAGPAAAGGAAPEIRSVDTSHFPVVHVSVEVAGGGQPPLIVSENGQRVPIAYAQHGAAAAVALALDTSRSMRGRPLRDAIAAASDFANRQPPGSPLAVYAFASGVQVASPFDPDRTGAVSALQELAPDVHPGTAIYGAVVRAAHDFRAVDAERRILVLLTDGHSLDDSSTLGQAVTAARAADVAVYPLTIGPPDPALRRLAAATDGETATVGSSAALAGAYRALAQRIADEQSFSYRSLAPSGSAVRLRVALPGGAAAQQSLRMPGQAASAAPAAHAGGGLGRTVTAAVIGALVVLAALVLLSARPAVIVKKRIAPYVAKRGDHAAAELFAAETHMSVLQQLFVATERVVGRMNFWRRMSARIEQADLPLRTAELLYIQLGSALLLCLVVGGLLHRQGIFALAAIAVGVAAPALFVRFKARRRLAAFEAQLPETLITMAASLKAGHSFNQAVQSVVQEGAEPTAKEFARVVAETQLGMAPETALEAMAVRMDSRNFGFVVMAVNIQRTVGGSLADILDMVADTVRQREQFGRKVKALTAQGRMSAYVLLAMPFLMALAIYAMNSSYMSVLFTTSAGKVMIAVGLTMMTIGAAVIRKIVAFRG